jgi:hypothetical protein
MFSFVAGLLVLLYQNRLKGALLWSVTGVVAVLFYFKDFKAYSGTDAFEVSRHFENPLYLFYNFFGFLGGILDYSENVNRPVILANIPALVLGFFIFIAVLWGGALILRDKFSGEKSPPDNNLRVTWLGMAAFILITAVVMAYSRTAGAAMNTLSSRYKIYSMIAWILVYCFLLIYFKNFRLKLWWFFGAVSSLIFMFNFYTSYDKFTNYKSYLLSGLFNYNYNGSWVIYRHTHYYEGASKVLSDSISKNPEPVYVFNPVFSELSHEALQQAALLNNIEVSEDIAGNSLRGKRISLHTNDYPEISKSFKGIYLVVYDSQSIYLLVAKPVRNGRMNMLRGGGYYKKGLFLHSDLGNFLKPGNQYNLAIFCPTDVVKIRRINHIIRG